MRLQRADDLVEEAGERRPRAGDLGGVDDDAAPPQRRQGRDVVAVPQPPLDQARRRAGARRPRSRTRRRRSAERAARMSGSASSRTMSTLVSPCSKFRSDSVSSYRRRTAGVAPRRRIMRHASRPAAKRREAEGAALLRRRQRVDAEAGLGDDAERPLAADEELGQVRPGGGPRALALGVHDAAVGQHHLEADDHVLDLPVAGRVLPRPAAGQPAADGREVHGLGPVAERVARADLARAPPPGPGRRCRPARPP